MTVGMAFVQECVCGYKKRDPSNWSKHRKACRALRVIEPLQRENERLRTLQQDATIYITITCLFWCKQAWTRVVDLPSVLHTGPPKGGVIWIQASN